MRSDDDRNQPAKFEDLPAFVLIAENLKLLPSGFLTSTMQMDPDAMAAKLNDTAAVVEVTGPFATTGTEVMTVEVTAALQKAWKVALTLKLAPKMVPVPS